MFKEDLKYYLCIISLQLLQKICKNPFFPLCPPSLQVGLSPLLPITEKIGVCPCKIIVNMSVEEVGVLYINKR